MSNWKKSSKVFISVLNAIISIIIFFVAVGSIYIVSSSMNTTSKLTIIGGSVLFIFVFLFIIKGIAILYGLLRDIAYGTEEDK